MATRFSWNDGVNSYTTPRNTPAVEEQYDGRGELVPLLSGGTFESYQYTTDAGGVTVQGPRRLTFEWSNIAPPELIPIVLATWQRHRQVTVTFLNPATGYAEDTITGYIPAQQQPEIRSQRARTTSLRVTVVELTV